LLTPIFEYFEKENWECFKFARFTLYSLLLNQNRNLEDSLTLHFNPAHTNENYNNQKLQKILDVPMLEGVLDMLAQMLT